MGELLKVRLATNLACEAVVFVPPDCPWDRLKGVIALRLGTGCNNLNIDHLILVDKNNEELSGRIKDTSTLCSFFEVYHADDDMAFLAYPSDSEDQQAKAVRESQPREESSFSRSLANLMANMDVHAQSWIDGTPHDDSKLQPIMKDSQKQNNQASSSSDSESMFFCLRSSSSQNKFEYQLTHDMTWKRLTFVLTSQLVKDSSTIEYLTLVDSQGDVLSSSISSMTSLWKAWMNVRKEIGIYFIIDLKSNNNDLSIDSNDESNTAHSSGNSAVATALAVLNSSKMIRNSNNNPIIKDKEPIKIIEENSTSNILNNTNTYENKFHTKFHKVTARLDIDKNRKSTFSSPVNCSWDDLITEITKGLSLNKYEIIDHIILVDEDDDDLSPPINSEHKFRKFDAIYGEDEDMICVIYLDEESLKRQNQSSMNKSFIFAHSNDMKIRISLSIPMNCTWDILKSIIYEGFELNSNKDEITHLLLYEENENGIMSLAIDNDIKFWKHTQLYIESNSLFQVFIKNKNSDISISVCIGYDMNNVINIIISKELGWNEVIDRLVSHFKDIPVYSIDHIIVIDTISGVNSQKITDINTLWTEISTASSSSTGTSSSNIIISLRQNIRENPMKTNPKQLEQIINTSKKEISHTTTHSTKDKDNILIKLKLNSYKNGEIHSLTIPNMCLWEDMIKLITSTMCLDTSTSTAVKYLILIDTDGDELSPQLNNTSKFWKFGSDYDATDGSYFQVYINNQSNLNSPHRISSTNNLLSTDSIVGTVPFLIYQFPNRKNTVKIRLQPDCTWDIIRNVIIKALSIDSEDAITHLILIDNDGDEISQKINTSQKFWNFGLNMNENDKDTVFAVHIDNKKISNNVSSNNNNNNMIDNNDDDVTIIQVTLAGSNTSSNTSSSSTATPRRGIARLGPHLTENELMITIAEALGTNQNFKWIVSLSLEDNIGGSSSELTGPLMSSTGFWKLYSKGYLAGKENQVVIYGEYPVVKNNTSEQFLNACIKGDRAMVKKLMTLNDLSIHYNDDDNMRPLHHAAKGGHLEVIKLLLTIDKDIDAADKKGMTPLHHACANTFADVALYLAKHGANVTAKNSVGLTPLHYICLRGMTQIASQFLQPNTMNLASSSGLSLLHCACDRGHLDIAEYLIKHGARVKSTDTEGLTPLQYACLKGYLDIAKLLVSHGASINIRDHDGMSAFLYAVSDGHLEVAKWLLSTGASLHARNNSGNNALHFAGDIGDKIILKWLVDCGMEINSKSYDGLTALHLALKMGRVDAAMWLEANGAKNRPETDEEAAERLQHDKLSEDSLRKSEFTAEERNQARNGNNTSNDNDGNGNGNNSIDMMEMEESVHFTTQDMNTSINSNANKPKPNVLVEDTEADIKLRDACSNGDESLVKQLLAGVANVHSRNDKGSRPLHFACVAGNLQIAKMLVDAGAEISAANLRGSTALHFACDRKHVELALWLFEQGSNLTMKTIEGYTPLHYICVRGLDTLLKAFSDKTTLDINVADNKNFTLLHCAAEEGHIEVVKLLTRLNANIHAKDSEQRLPLHLACLRTHMFIAKCLVECNADINVEDFDGNTPLFYACLGGSLELAKWLIASGAIVNKSNKRGNSCLHAACQIGHKDMALWLVQAGISLELKNNSGHTAIDFANESQHQGLAKILEKKLEDLKAINKTRIEQLTLFHDACIGPDVTLVEEFLQNGADPNAKNENESISLHFSCASGQEETTKLLIARGAIVNTANNTGLTPFHCACLGGHLSLAKYLVHQVGVDFQKKTKTDTNALHQSAHNGHLKVVKWLVSLGVSIESIKDDGFTVMHEACRGGHSAVVKYLVKQSIPLTIVTRDGISTMQVACAMGYLELAQWLHTEGVSIDNADNFGITPFLASCAAGQMRTIKWLVSLGVNTRMKGGKIDVLDTALHHTCRTGHMDVVKYLMEIGHDPYSPNEKLQTPIEVAVNEDNADIAYWLTARGPHFMFENLAKGNSIHPQLDRALLSKDFEDAKNIIEKIISDKDPNIAPGSSPLHFAAVAGNLEFTQYLLNISRIDVNVETTVGLTPLHYAAYSGKFDLIQYLVGQGALIGKECQTGDTAESIAIRNNHGYVARWLKDLQQSYKNKNNISPFAYNIESGKKSSRSLLFACMSSDLPLINCTPDAFKPKASQEQELNEENNNANNNFIGDEDDNINESFSGINAELHTACAEGRIDIVKSLLDKGNINVNEINPVSYSTPLHIAALTGNCSLGEILVEKGAKLDIQNIGGMSPLHIACDHMHAAFALFLIRKGADISLRNKLGDTTLHKMCSRGMLELITKIIELPRSVLRVLDLDVKTDKGVSLLHTVVEHGHRDVMLLLINQSVNVNPRDEENRIPLHYACIKGNYEIAEDLIKNGAFVKARDNQGNSPLLCACIARNLPLAKLLYKNGANVHADDAAGNNALHIVCQAGEIEMAKWLVGLNVNPSQCSNAGITATQYANVGGFSELFEWLLAWTLASSVGGTVEEVLAETRSVSNHSNNGLEEEDSDDDDEDDDNDGRNGNGSNMKGKYQEGDGE
eukprot:gene1173-2281_t